MQAFRVFPWVRGARPERPGHPLYVHSDQGAGRLDNPSLFHVLYLALQADGAVGEAFGGLTVWRPEMLAMPMVPGSERRLGRYELADETPLLDLDDARALVERDLHPTQVVTRDRAVTQTWARRAFEEGRWSGIRWWSVLRPEWTVLGLWAWQGNVEARGVEELTRHPALEEAARVLARVRVGV